MTTKPGRPVARRASLIAPSLASAPLLQKNEYWRSPGVTSARRSASAAMGALGIVRTDIGIRSSWSRTAARTRGWRWPTLKIAGPHAQSMYSRPWTSQTRHPSAAHSTVSTPPNWNSRASPGLRYRRYCASVRSISRARSAPSGRPAGAGRGGSGRGRAMPDLRRLRRLPGRRRGQHGFGLADHLAGFLVLAPLQRFRHRHPIAAHEPFFALRAGLFPAEELHQVVVHRLVIIGVFGLPEEQIALFPEVAHDPDVVDPGFLGDLPERDGLRGLPRLDRSLGKHPLAGFVLQEQDAVVGRGGGRTGPAIDDPAGAVGPLYFPGRLAHRTAPFTPTAGRAPCNPSTRAAGSSPAPPAAANPRPGKISSSDGSRPEAQNRLRRAARRRRFWLGFS